jgi:hypothetical protein
VDGDVLVRRGRLAFLAAALAVGCFERSAGSASVADPRVIERWLTCEECVAGELDTVVAMGGDAVPALTAALAGPPDSVTANFTGSSAMSFTRARRAWERLSPVDRTKQPLSDSAAFVNATVASFRSLYQLRAARALDVIDRQTARVLFRGALARDSVGPPLFRADVRRTLDSLANSPP